MQISLSFSANETRQKLKSRNKEIKSAYDARRQVYVQQWTTSSAEMMTKKILLTYFINFILILSRAPFV